MTSCAYASLQSFRGCTSSETLGLPVGTMRYFRAKVCFKNRQATGQLFTEPVLEMFEFCPADWPENYVGGQDGWIYIGQVPFLRVYGPRRSRVHNLAKKKRGQYPPILTKQTWSIKDLLYGFRDNFSCGIQRAVSNGQDGSILPARVANDSTRFGLPCPLAELAI